MLKSRYRAVRSISKNTTSKETFMLSEMQNNKSLQFYNSLSRIKEKYKWYRDSWANFPDLAYQKKYNAKDLKKIKFPPLCVDLELAAVCDLACPFCYRNFIATPDKIMKKELAFKIIDQCKELGVPSMKFNWRGEPLMHPNLSEIINYAKNNGVIETIINTNATHLNNKVSEKIIQSGLDILIYSFDGGTKETYEKMRPGRFKENTFEEVYKNIKNFNEMKLKLNSKFPRTQIQMIITKDTVNEIDSYYKLFSNIVDDVSVKNFTDRGENLDALSEDEKIKVMNFCESKKIKFKNYLRDSENNLYVSQSRLPCEQPLQRLMVTYDGVVSMCCYDWGSYYPVGYLDEKGFINGNKEYLKVKKLSDQKKRGYQMMNLKIPELLNEPEKKVSTVGEVWFGTEIQTVRDHHAKKEINKVSICKSCPFKETYNWQKV